MNKAIGRALILGLAAVSSGAMAQLVTLSNGGSTASFNVGTSAGNGNFGLNNWRIANGPNNVVQEVFAVTFPGAGVQTLNELSAPVFSQPTADLLNVQYISGNVDFQVRYLLTGGAPNSADLAEVVTIFNRNNGAVSFKFWEYDYFSPGGATGGTGTLLNSSTIKHTNNGWNVTVGATPIPDRWMIDTSGNVVNGIVAGNLTNANSPFSNPTDLAFAYQWNVTINPGETWQMSKNKLLQAVPEPSTMVALASLSALALFRRRKSK